jgi:capping protein (actin filament) muscle Z-line, alpha
MLFIIAPHPDVRNIISDDDSLQDGVLPALQEYNLAQFMTVDVPGTGHQVGFEPLTSSMVCVIFVPICQAIVSDAAKLPGLEGEEERFLDPRSKTSFVFDHLSLVRLALWSIVFKNQSDLMQEASDPQPVESEPDSEPFRYSISLLHL